MTVGLLLVLPLVMPAVARAPLSAPTTIDNGYGLNDVACPSSSQCAAVDSNGQEVTFNPTSPGSPTATAIDTNFLLSVAYLTAGSGITQVGQMSSSASLTGLTAHTTYHFRISATNAGGTSKGADETLKTLPNSPTVVTEKATPIAQTTATLNGSVNPNGRRRP